MIWLRKKNRVEIYLHKNIFVENTITTARTPQPNESSITYSDITWVKRRGWFIPLKRFLFLSLQKHQNIRTFFWKL